MEHWCNITWQQCGHGKIITHGSLQYVTLSLSSFILIQNLNVVMLRNGVWFNMWVWYIMYVCACGDDLQEIRVVE